MTFVGYFAGHYITIFMQSCPLQSSSVILDLFFVLGVELIDHLLIGMLQACRNKILKLERIEDVIIYIKNELLQSFLQNNGLRKILTKESIDQFLQDYFYGFEVVDDIEIG